MERHDSSPEWLPALELFHQLLNLSPDDGDRSLLISIRLPNARLVGDVWLSKRDVEGLIDASIGLSMLNHAEDAAEAGVGVTVPQDQVDEVVAGFEALLKAEGDE